MSRAATLWEALEIAGSGSSSVTFLLDGARREVLPYREVLAKARSRAAAFVGRGVGPSDRVVLLASTSRELVFDFFGLLAIGAIPAPQAPPNPFGDVEDYAHRLAATVSYLGARYLVASGALAAGLAPLLPGCSVLAPPFDGDPLPLDAPAPSAENVAFVQCTSGSTGHPKGVVLGHDNVVANIRQIGDGLAVTPDDRVVSWLPLHHDMGLIGCLAFSVYWGLDLCLMAPHLFLRRPATWLATISDFRGSLSPAPNFAYSFATARVSEKEAAELDLASWRVALCGAEPIDARVLRAFGERFGRHGLRQDVLTPCYGLAEATLAVAFHPLGTPIAVDRVDRVALAERGVAAPVARDDPSGLDVVSSGRTLAGTQVRVVDKHGQVLPDAHVGRVQVRGPSVMRGYYQLAEESGRTLVDGWLDTGDLGYLRAGLLHLTGRAKDVIIIRGRNYPPNDFEWAAEEVAGIRRGGVVAFGLGDPEEGTEALYLVCETEVEGLAARGALAHDVRARVLAHTSVCPKEVFFVAKGTVPKTSSGKLQRRRTRELYLKACQEGRSAASRPTETERDKPPPPGGRIESAC